MQGKLRRSRKKQDVSVYTLAADLGLSPGTVSRALRNSPEIGIQTRTIVRKKAADLGFKLRNFEPRVTNICFVLETAPKQRSLFSSYVDAILDGVWRYCNEQDIELSLFGEELDRLSKCDLVRVLGRRGVNGAVFLNASKQSPYFTSLNEQNFPYCCVMTGPPEAAAWTIRADSSGMAERGTRHLLDLGHRRIAFVDTLKALDIGFSRRDGYHRALKQAGLGPEAAIFFDLNDCASPPSDAFDFASQAVQLLMNRPHPPTAILTMSDEEGLAALHELSVMGIKVPEAVSVMTFDDSRFCEFCAPPLTVLSLNYEKVGMEAATIVHRRIEKISNEIPQAPVVVRGDLIVRGSSGPAAQLKPRQEHGRSSQTAPKKSA